MKIKIGKIQSLEDGSIKIDGNINEEDIVGNLLSWRGKDAILSLEVKTEEEVSLQRIVEAQMDIQCQNMLILERLAKLE